MSYNNSDMFVLRKRKKKKKENLTVIEVHPKSIRGVESNSQSILMRYTLLRRDAEIITFTDLTAN